MNKTLDELRLFLDQYAVDWASPDTPILVDTGTMKFSVIGFEIQHGGPLDKSIVLKMGEAADK